MDETMISAPLVPQLSHESKLTQRPAIPHGSIGKIALLYKLGSFGKVQALFHQPVHLHLAVISRPPIK